MTAQLPQDTWSHIALFVTPIEICTLLDPLCRDIYKATHAIMVWRSHMEAIIRQANKISTRDRYYNNTLQYHDKILFVKCYQWYWNHLNGPQVGSNQEEQFNTTSCFRIGCSYTMRTICVGIHAKGHLGLFSLVYDEYDFFNNMHGTVMSSGCGRYCSTVISSSIDQHNLVHDVLVGTDGVVVTELSIVYDDQTRRIYIPGTQETSLRFCDAPVIGFAGNCENYVNRIGLVCLHDYTTGWTWAIPELL
jgi:hypothetical protein